MERKLALVTGATSGIGAAYARRLAKDGYNLIITGRRAEKIEALARSLTDEYRCNCEVILLDLADRAALDRLITKVAGLPVEFLVNNAGFGYNSLFFESDISQYEKMVAVHVLAPMLITRAVLPGMVTRNSGTIVNVSSDGIYLLIPKNSIYSATKSFLKVFSEALRLELMATNIRVQALIPGLTKTDFHEKMGFAKSRQKNNGLVQWMDPSEVVEASMKVLHKNKLICIPSRKDKLMISFLSGLPRNIYYKLISHFFLNKFQKG
jgi:short-subunit dehydrogenase